MRAGTRVNACTFISVFRFSFFFAALRKKKKQPKLYFNFRLSVSRICQVRGQEETILQNAFRSPCKCVYLHFCFSFFIFCFSLRCKKKKTKNKNKFNCTSIFVSHFRMEFGKRTASPVKWLSLKRGMREQGNRGMGNL